MKGLMLKDLLNLKKQGKVIPLIIIFYTVFAAFVEDYSFFLSFVVLMCAMLPVTTIAYDEKSNWDKYALTMPISRKDLVTSKYVFGLLCMLLGIVIVILFRAVIAAVKAEPFEYDLLSLLLVLFSSGVLFLSLSMPLVYRFGTEKGRFLLIAIAIVILLPMTSGSVQKYQSTLISIIDYLYLLPIIALIIGYLSMLISIKIVEKKSFA